MNRNTRRKKKGGDFCAVVNPDKPEMTQGIPIDCAFIAKQDDNRRTLKNNKKYENNATGIIHLTKVEFPFHSDTSEVTLLLYFMV